MDNQNNIVSGIGQALADVSVIFQRNLETKRAKIIQERYGGDANLYQVWCNETFASSGNHAEKAEYEWLCAVTMTTTGPILPTEYPG